MGKTVYIPSVDGKDLYLSECCDDKNSPSGFSLLNLNGEINLRRFVAALDYSLDQIKLREVYEKVYRRIDFSFSRNGKLYSSRVINCTFKYKVCEFNLMSSKSKKKGGKPAKNQTYTTYVKLGYDGRKLSFNDCVAVVDGCIVGIQLDKHVGCPVSDASLGKYFSYDSANKVYALAKNPKCVLSTADIRAHLYKHGFYCGGIHYVRWKRSSGSARVGKCLFIDERLYSRMHKWEMCGLSVSAGDDVDLAALESYISLTSSSIIDTLEIHPENILVVPDYESVFKDEVVSVVQDGAQLKAVNEERTMKNNIFDGYGALDVSMFGKYGNKGMMLLRNQFFKCCCFNCNLQQWFADNDITEVSQLNGQTLAKDISEIMLVTTPSSIKYLKFAGFEQWLENIPTTFGVVKTDKPTHYFDGRMVQTHYQLLNSLRLSKDEVKAFLSPSFEYMNLLKSSPAVLRNHIKYPIWEDISITPAKSKSDVVYKMLGVNDKFAKTRLYHDFLQDILKSMSKNMRLGRVLVDGNYETLIGNPMEFLKHTIGKFDGSTSLGVGNVCTKRFPPNTRVVGSRSPHIAPSNVWVPMNVANKDIDTYWNFTNEILAINVIGENVMERLSGCDFDSDSILVTDNEILVNAAMRDAGVFKIGVSDVLSRKTPRKYTPSQQADLDIKTSNNLIGDLVNESQELNTLMWDNLNRGCGIDEIQDIYNDICILNVMSEIEIDKAKKEFSLNSSKELNRLRQKYIRKDDNRLVKPNFFAAKDRSKGYYDNEKKAYNKHLTSMDFVQELINAYLHTRSGVSPKNQYIPFSDVVMTDDYIHRPSRTAKVRRVIELVRNSMSSINYIYSDPTIEDADRRKFASEERQNLIEYIGGLSLSNNTMIALLLAIEDNSNRDIRRILFNTLFGYPNASFYKVLRQSYSSPTSITEDGDGEVIVYGKKYKFTNETVF